MYRCKSERGDRLAATPTAGGGRDGRTAHRRSHTRGEVTGVWAARPVRPPAHTHSARAGRCEESATPEEGARGGDSREGKLRSARQRTRHFTSNILGVGVIEARNPRGSISSAVTETCPIHPKPRCSCSPSQPCSSNHHHQCRSQPWLWCRLWRRLGCPGLLPTPLASRHRRRTPTRAGG